MEKRKKNNIFNSKDCKRQKECVKLFFTFLSRKNALDKFIYNLNFMRKHNPSDNNYNERLFSIEGFMDLPYDMDLLIVQSFYWRSSVEGDNYWLKLSREWNTLCKKYMQIGEYDDELRRKMFSQGIL